jgi:hypothetical protein
MFRKILIAFAALAVIGGAAFTFTATPASAFDGWRQHRSHNHWRPAVRYRNHNYSYASCYVRRVVHTYYGPRVQLVNICY